MKPNLRQGIITGILGGIVVLLFGGWSVMVVGIILGITLGLTSSKTEKSKDWKKLAISGARLAAVASLIMILFAVFENYVLAPAAGSKSSDIGTLVRACLIGSVGSILIAALFAAIENLSSKQARLVKLVILAILIFAFPFVDEFTGLRWTSQLIFALIFVILGLGLNIVVGFAGLLDLGYAAFFAIGAYTAAILSSQHLEHSFNLAIRLDFWIVIWIAAVVAGVSGLVLGAPTLPLRGDYLAIVTLGFGEIVPVIFRNLNLVTVTEPITCWVLPAIIRLFGGQPGISCITLLNNANVTAGELGINPIGRPSLPIVGEFPSGDPKLWYFLILLIILLSVFLIRRLRDSRLGRAWMAIREDELAAAQMGIDPVRTKLLAFAMGATFSGFAGAFYGAYIRAIFPTVFDFSISIIVLVIIILGGLGNITGVIVGGLVVMTADTLFLPALKDVMSGLLAHLVLPALTGNPALQSAIRDNANPILFRSLFFGLTLVIMMAVRPEGLLPNAQLRAELHKDEQDKLGEPESAGDIEAEPSTV